MKKLVKVLSFLVLAITSCNIYSQNFNWSGYVRTSHTPVGAANYSVAYTSGTLTTIMTANITSSAGTGIFQTSSPKYSNSTNPMGTSATCMPTGLLLSVDWANKTSYVQIDINLGNGTNGVCGPVKFSIGDINSDGSTFQDMVDITATRANGTAITPNKPASIPPNNSYITGGCSYSWSYSDCNQSSTPGGGVLRYTGSSSCTDWSNNFVEVGTTSDQVKTISIKYYSGSSGIAANPAAQYIIISNILTNGFTPCSITYLLPIELTYFNVQKNKEKVDLFWQTASEKNNDSFVVERSADGSSFEPIGNLKGAGNSLHTLNYAFNDPNPLAGINYYRLKQTDVSGTFQYSSIIDIEMPIYKATLNNIHPNPASNHISYDFFAPVEGDVLIQVLDYTGIPVYSSSRSVDKGKSEMEVDLSDLPSGIYTLSVGFDRTGFQSFTKLIKN